LKSRIVIAVTLLSGFLLCSCGSTFSSSNPGATIRDGNWSIQTVSSATGATLNMGATLMQSGNTVTGTLLDPSYVGCSDPLIGPQSIPLTGAFQNDALTMTSPSYSLTLKGTGTGTYISGTSSNAGDCPQSALNGNLSGTYIPSISGNWTSTFVLNGQTVTLTVDLTQGNTVNDAGYLPLTGMATLSGSSCFEGGNSSPTVSYISGNNMSFGVGTSGVIFSLTGKISNSSATTIDGNFWFPSTVCGGQTGTIQLTKQ